MARFQVTVRLEPNLDRDEAESETDTVHAPDAVTAAFEMGVSMARDFDGPFELTEVKELGGS